MRHQIGQDAAVKMIARARQPKAWGFHREILDAMLAQPGAAGIRIYMGRSAEGTATPVVVAFDGVGKDLLGVIAEEAAPCPPFCDVSSPLHDA